MGLRDWIRRLMGSDPPPGDDLLRDSSPPPSPPGAAPMPTAQPRREVDRVQQLSALPLGEAIDRALSTLSQSTDRSASEAVLRWLRETVAREGLPPTAALRSADFFGTRGEFSTQRMILQRVARGPIADAPEAMMRLADLAAQEGDVEGARSWYESTLAIDLDHPGARERLARLQAPARPGESGATLLAPDARAGVGRYALLRELGRGGAGAVFLARDTRMGREVALKIYHPQARSDRDARLRGEARVAAAVACPSVVRVYGLHHDVGALVMEYAPGGSIRAPKAREGVTAATRRAWLTDLARALARTHAAGFVHRDVKPGNVLLRADGRAVLTDFGLARAVGQPFAAMEGTAGYVPPDVRGGGVATPSIDVYAWGAVARELSGDRDAALAPLVARCLDASPERPVDGGALLAALRALPAA